MRRSLRLLLLPGLAIAAPAAAQSPTGRYRLTGEPDVASVLELRPNGHFAYALEAGALDEQAEGRWTSDGKVVRLTTEPKPRPAVFKAATSAITSEVPLRIKVTSPDGAGIPGVDLVVRFASGDPVGSYTQEDGWSLPTDEKRRPQTLQLGIEIYGVVSPVFSLDTAAANDLTFILVPNDLGTVDFEERPLTIEKDALVMTRGEGKLTYTRQRSK